MKNGVVTPFLQIREGLGPNRVLKPKAKKKRKGETRQCHTGMSIKMMQSILVRLTIFVVF